MTELLAIGPWIAPGFFLVIAVVLIFAVKRALEDARDETDRIEKLEKALRYYADNRTDDGRKALAALKERK